MKQIENRYRDGRLHLRATETIRMKTKRLVNSCKEHIAKRKICRTPNPERQRQEQYHNGLYDLFKITQSSNGENSNEMVELESSSNSSEIPSTSSYSSNSSNASNENESQNSIDFDHSNYVQNSDSSDSDHDSDHDPDPDYDPSEDANDCSPQQKTPVTAELLNKINVCKASYRVSESLLNVGVQIGGADPIAFGISKSNLWTKITKLRSMQKTEKLASLAAETSPVVIQFDGKCCTRLKERHVGTEERLIILCRTEERTVPLGFFAIESKSGYDCATEVLRALNENDLSNRVIGLVTDTEPANTGRYNGACALIEQSLEKELLHLMCRHHVKEVMLRDVFTAVFGTSQSANVMTFDTLKENWEHIKRSSYTYQSIRQDVNRTPLIARLTEEALETISQHASSEILRSDYSELNDLVLKFLGKATDKAFNVPGARNNARWMARLIYGFKTFLFRDHLDLYDEFIELLERFCIFGALIYVKHWNRCSNPVDAPFNDLVLMKEIDEYKQIDEEIADVALQAHKRHLWYLSDELVVLSLFCDKVSSEEKLLMQQMITRQVGNRTENSITHTAEIDDIQNIELHDFISPRSYFLFDQLGLNVAFFGVDPGEWDEMYSFKKAKQTIIRLITVVNDSAERAVQFGASIISNQRVQSESRLQDMIVSLNT